MLELTNMGNNSGLPRLTKLSHVRNTALDDIIDN